MSAIPDHPQQPACDLLGLFTRDTQIVARLDDAQSRVHAAKSTRLEIPWP